MNLNKISTVLIAISALSAAPVLASELCSKTSNSANVFTVKFVKAGPVKDNARVVKSNLGIETSSCVSSRYHKRSNLDSKNKVLILGGSEVIPM